MVASIATLKLRNGHSGVTDAKGWKELTRTAIIQGLTGDGDARLDAALEVSGMPEIGDAHPHVSDLKLKEIRPEAATPSVVKVRLVYRRLEPTSWENPQDNPDYMNIQVGTTVSQVQSNLDVDGNPITVSYTPSGESEVTVSSLVTKTESRSTIVIERRESSSPGDNSREYTNTVNIAGWRHDPGAQPRTWKCVSIVGRSDDGGDTYLVTYTFEFKADMWDFDVVYIDSSTGRPPSNPAPSASNGIETYQLYEMKNFNSLHL